MLAHNFYSYCFSLLACYCTCSLKPVGNHNGEQQVKLTDPTSLPIKEIPFSVISAANNDIESSMKESSTKRLFISACTKTGYLRILLWNFGLESQIFVK